MANKTAVIGGVRIETSRPHHHQDTDLFITLTHHVSDENLAAQHESILDNLRNMGAELSYEHSTAIYALLYRMLDLSNEIGDFGEDISLKFMFVVDTRQQRATDRLKDS